MPIPEVWQHYKAQPTQALRNRLLENYLPLVRYAAERLHHKLPQEIDVDDLISAGIFGLKDAIDSFDLGRGVKFETFCVNRIRGAILDELRAMDWVPRLVRSRSTQVEQARKSLQMQYGRNPTDEELAEKMQLSPEEFERVRRDAGAVGVVSLSRKWFETDSSKDVREIDVLEDARQTNPVNVLQRRDLRELITRGLSRSERMVLILYYYEQMTMKEIGLVLDLSESRVSQMHSSIIQRLRANFQNRAEHMAQQVE